MVRQKSPQLMIIEGAVWSKDNKEAARFNHRAKEWEMRTGWTTLNIDMAEFQKAATPRQ